jgi:hypothetical protein
MTENFVENPCARCGEGRRGLEEPCAECGWKPDAIEKRTTFRPYRPPRIPSSRIPFTIVFLEALFKLPSITAIGILLAASAAMWTLVAALFLDVESGGGLAAIAGGLFQILAGFCFCFAGGLVARQTNGRKLVTVAIIFEIVAVALALLAFKLLADQ